MNGLDILLILVAIFLFFLYVSISSNWYHELAQIKKKEQEWLEIYVPNLEEIIMYERSSKFINNIAMLLGKTNSMLKSIKKLKHIKFNLDLSKAYRELSINKNITQ